MVVSYVVELMISQEHSNGNPNSLHEETNLLYCETCLSFVLSSWKIKKLIKFASFIDISNENLHPKHNKRVLNEGEIF